MYYEQIMFVFVQGQLYYYWWVFRRRIVVEGKLICGSFDGVVFEATCLLFIIVFVRRASDAPVLRGKFRAAPFNGNSLLVGFPFRISSSSTREGLISRK